MTEIHAYWLIPAEPFRRWCAAQIASLAQALDAPVFEPHVTIYARSAVGNASPAALLAQTIGGVRPITLQAVRVDHSEKFTKTLFIEFAYSPALARLSAQLRESSPTSADYKVQPHLSLVYKHLPKQRRALLARSTKIRFKRITFDEVAVVMCPERTQNARDVRAWHVLHRQAM